MQGVTSKGEAYVPTLTVKHSRSSRACCRASTPATTTAECVFVGMCPLLASSRSVTYPLLDGSVNPKVCGVVHFARCITLGGNDLDHGDLRMFAEIL